MPLRRLFGVLTLVTGISIGLVGPAVAAPYGPRTGSATVSSTRVAQGQAVTVSGDGFCADALVTVTVAKGSHVISSSSVRATHAGSAATSVTLRVLGSNTLQLKGCFSPTQEQVLEAAVVVVPHAGAAKVSDDKVSKGDKVTVRAAGFCKNAKVKVRVSDDGKTYRTTTVKGSRAGVAKTSVKLTRVGRATITLTGCSKSGGTLVRTAHVKVVTGKSFRASSAAYAGDVAGSVSPIGFAAIGGGLLALFIAAQVTFARRRRSS